MNAGLIVIILLLVLSILGIPIYLALGIGTLVALNMADMPFIVLPQKLFAGMNSSSLLAIPFFMLAGNIMSRSITAVSYTHLMCIRDRMYALQDDDERRKCDDSG